MCSHCEGKEPDPNFCNFFGQLFITDFKAQPISHLHVQQACSSQAVLTHTCQALASGLIRPHKEEIRSKLITLSPSLQMPVTHLSNNVGQSRVAQQEPAPRRDPVCLVLKLLWLQLIEILEPGTPGSSEPPTTTQSFSWAPTVCAPDSGQSLQISL